MRFKRLGRGGTALLVALWAGSFFPTGAGAACNTAADMFLSTGLGRLRGDTMDLSQALLYFDSAVSADASGCSAAYVARTMVRIAQLYDTDSVKSLRNAFGDTTTYDTFLTDTRSHSNKQYSYSPSTMDADDFQSVLGGPVLSIINLSILDLQLVESAGDTNWQLPVPGRFLARDTTDWIRTAEVDHTDLLFFAGALQMTKALIYLTTSYDFNVSRDWRHFKDAEHDTLPDGDTFARHVLETATSFFTLRTGASDSMTTVSTLMNTADTKFALFYGLLAAEINTDGVQDTDLIASLGFQKFHRDTGFWDAFSETDIAEDSRDLNDTGLKSLSGQILSIQLTKENQDLGSFRVRPRTVLDTPLTRTLFPSSTTRTHGIEFDREDFFPEPTFGGLFPGATNRDLFVIGESTDSYFIVTTLPVTLNLDSLLSGKRQDEIDIRFDTPTGTGVAQIARRVNGDYICTITVSPSTSTSSHLRIFFSNAERNDFTSGDRGRMKQMLDSTLVYVVPWAVSAGHAVDAGRAFSAFSSYYRTADTNQVHLHWLRANGDTLMMFRFGTDADATEFKSLGSSASVTNLASGQTVVSANVNRFGWFVLAETAAALKVVDGALVGETGQLIGSSFVVKVANEYGTGISGVPVSFSVVSVPGDSNGALSSSSATTNSQGEASVAYQLGSGYGVYKLKATAEGNVAFLFGFVAGHTPHNSANKWRMISMPVYPGSSLPALASSDTSVYGRLPPAASVGTYVEDDFSSVKIYYWDEAQTTSEAGFSDADHNHYIVPSSMRMGRAYWIKTTTNGTLDAVSGNVTHAHVENGDPETSFLPL